MDDLDDAAYNARIECLRTREYPSLTDTLYLDHAGTPPVPCSLMERFSSAMVSNMYGNPHSSSTASLQTGHMIENVRLDVLRMFRADPADFDVVFVANATAGIKLVVDSFRDGPDGFWYGYHRDAHTSLVGGRETATQHRCFESDSAVDDWISRGCPEQDQPLGHRLFAFPAQSNMNGHRLPLRWSRDVRSRSTAGQPIYTLLDAAALVPTCPLDLSDPDAAPDFTVVSFYKIFGFPDLGALIVRKASSAILRQRRYFGGGTVDLVLCLQEQWHLKKTDSLHSHLEDGTLPIHSILALGCAFPLHRELFGSFERISRHVSFLVDTLHSKLRSLRHASGAPVCQLYVGDSDGSTGGSILALNFRTPSGECVQLDEVEKLAAVRNISLRTGGVCNPGGISASLGLAPWEIRRNFSAGARCGTEDGEGWAGEGKPTGIVRVSFGASSSMSDVERFLAWVDEFFVHAQNEVPTKMVVDAPPSSAPANPSAPHPTYAVESITVYPIKSCAGFVVPSGQPWSVRREGLAWDREWCIVHQGTGAALSMKRYPHMANLKPKLDLGNGVLRIEYLGAGFEHPINYVEVPLSEDPRPFEGPSSTTNFKDQMTRVCGDVISTRTYQCAKISEFLSNALGVSCRLARYSRSFALQGAGRKWRGVSGKRSTDSQREQASVPGSYPSGQGPDDEHDSAVGFNSDQEPPQCEQANPILLANESPILVINRASVSLLNKQVRATGTVHAAFDLYSDRFRANIVIGPSPFSAQDDAKAYEEDTWCDERHALTFLPDPFDAISNAGPTTLQVLGPCRRCQIVCVNPRVGERDLAGEPFITLAKTRRERGRGGVRFGIHCGLRGTTGSVFVGQEIAVAAVPSP